MKTQAAPRVGQRARRRALIVNAVNTQAQAIVTVEERRKATEQRLQQLEDRLATSTLYERLRWLVLGR